MYILNRSKRNPSIMSLRLYYHYEYPMERALPTMVLLNQRRSSYAEILRFAHWAEREARIRSDLVLAFRTSSCDKHLKKGIS